MSEHVLPDKKKKKTNLRESDLGALHLIEEPMFPKLYRHCSVSRFIEKHFLLGSFHTYVAQSQTSLLTFSPSLPQAVFTTWFTPLSWPMMKRCKLVSMMVLRLQKLARYSLLGNFWDMTAVMRAGWRMAVSATLSLGQEGAAVPLRLRCASWVSQIKSISCMVSTASEHTTKRAL